MDHSVVTTRCDGCHYGAMAVGLPVNHLQTSAQCDACHGTSTWRNARFDHAEVFAPCSSCHDGTTGTGKDPVSHISTTAECDVCHSTRRWSPATFDHSLVMGSCSSCHNGREATGVPTPHFQSILECDACHTTTRWTSPTYAHSGMYPGDHRQALDCTDCHGGNSDLVTWPSPTFQPDCAACHERDFKADSHKKVDSPELKYTVSELRDCAGACHEFQDASMTVIKQRRDSEHRVGDSQF